jgi:hypothetical protein
VIASSTYPWPPLGQASEIDRIGSATKLLLSEHIQISGTASFSWTVSDLREVPVPGFVLASSPHC